MLISGARSFMRERWSVRKGFVFYSKRLGFSNRIRTKTRFKLTSNVLNTTGQKTIGRLMVIDLIVGGFSALFKKETVSNWAYNGFGESRTNKIVY